MARVHTVDRRCSLCFFLGILSLTSCTDPAPAFHRWQILFDPPELEREDSRFVVRVINGWCTSPAVIAEWEMGRWNEAEIPLSLTDGLHGMWVGVSDRQCQWYAEGCQNLTFPIKEGASVEVLLRPRPPLARCASSVCDDGACPSWASSTSASCGEDEVIPRGDDARRLLDADSETTCAVRGGEVWCWGRGVEGQLGNGAREDSAVPVQVMGLQSILSVAVGHSFACALAEDGQVWCWGSNANGQLGTGTDEDFSEPTAVPHLAGVTGLAASGNHVCAREASGAVRCWGQNLYFQSGGEGTLDVALASPIEGLTDARTIEVGDEASCAISRCGDLVCWGANWAGERGDADPAPRRGPGLVVLDRVLSVTLAKGAWGHTCAVTQSHEAFCWGNNRDGQLGDGTRDSGWLARRPLGLPEVQELGAGSCFTCALGLDGSVWCWGCANDGRLGQEGQHLAPSPVVVGAAVDLAVGGSHGCVQNAAGEIWCWGANNRGQLGDGTTDYAWSPVQVTGLP